MNKQLCVFSFLTGVHETKKQSISRPFGVALLIAGVDNESGPSLWCTDPSGTNTKYEAAAIGSAQEGAESLLHEKFHSNMSLRGTCKPEKEKIRFLSARKKFD